MFNDEAVATSSVKALYLLDRIGDTESLVSVESVKQCEWECIENREEWEEIDTSTRADSVQNINGEFSISTQCIEDFSLQVRRLGREEYRHIGGYLNELRERYMRVMYLPLRTMRINRKIIYLPSRYRVITARGFNVFRVKGIEEACLVVGVAECPRMN